MKTIKKEDINYKDFKNGNIYFYDQIKNYVINGGIITNNKINSDGGGDEYGNPYLYHYKGNFYINTSGNEDGSDNPDLKISSLRKYLPFDEYKLINYNLRSGPIEIIEFNLSDGCGCDLGMDVSGYGDTTCNSEYMCGSCYEKEKRSRYINY